MDYIEVFVEIPRGSRNKYEYDKQRRVFVLDRVLYASVHYPTDYGFIPETLGADGDPLDALVIVNEPTFPGCLIHARPIGLLDMYDDKGDDEKVLAVPIGDPRFDEVLALADISPHWLREIENFFLTYKTLEQRETHVRGWRDAAAAWQLIAACRAAYRQREADRISGRLPGPSEARAPRGD
ncbi:MAG TPA: inorganic diphosphatase [Chloroflexota bacterium]|jgi:inorganic pyrophosphatase|nr:inorganic diphosphatase [Chloroflexota bacterium]